MKIIKLSKGKGKFRVIFAPDADEKKVLRDWLPTITGAAKQADVHNVVHGFREGRSPLTNALAHVGHKFTLTMDLKDFFDSVTAQMVPEALRFSGAFIRDDGTPASTSQSLESGQQVALYGIARQGLPTSPAMANIAAAPMDRKILELRSQRGRFSRDFVYTRYADDMTFSFEEELTGEMLKREVPLIAASFGFTINESKTRLQSARCGRRIITGIAVDATGAYPTRHMKRRLRAARHQRHTSEARGLAEWMRLRMPKQFKASNQVVNVKPKVATITAPKATATTQTGKSSSNGKNRQFDLE